MRKVSLVIAALALVLGITQCKKQENSVLNGEKQHIVLNASFGDSNAKIDQEGAGLKWTVGDIINVMQGTEKLGELECKNIDGTFEGTITTPTGDITFTFGELDYMGQSGELNGAIYLESGEKPANAEGEYDVWMNMPYAVLKLDVSAFVGTTKDNTPLKISVGGTPVASVTNVTNPSAVFVAVPTDGSEKYYTITCNDKGAVKKLSLQPNTFYTASDGQGGSTGGAAAIKPAPDGAILGLFSVAPDKQVYFSKGNLWADASGSNASNPVLHFETNQYAFNIDYSNKEHVSYFTWSSDVSVAVGTSNSGNNLFCDESHKVSVDGGDAIFYALSKDEWTYLFSNHSYKWASVNGVNGYVIAPDDFSGELASSYADDAALAAAGNLVFLPAAGRRDGSSVNYVGDFGYYWSSSARDENYAYIVRFDSGDVDPGSRGHRTYGFSVRLITESK